MTQAARPRRCNRLVVLTGISLLCGCCSFEKKWQAAAFREADGPRGIEGRWAGSWQSDANSHSGGLRCIITKGENGAYAAEYKATYWGIFKFGYAMQLSVNDLEGGSDAEAAFVGEADLGWLAGGMYRYEGTASASKFFCKYGSKYDHGTFTMTRPNTSK